MPKTPTDGPAQPRLFPANVFDGFGPSRFRPAVEPVVGRKFRSKQPARLKKQVRAHAPRSPGVYGMIDDRGRLVYVGKAKNLRARLLSYFREKSRDPKAGKIVRHTRVLVWEQIGDELAALLRELELIQTLRPKFNVLGVPGLQRHHYVCVGKAPAPHVYVTNKPTGKELGVYGPLVIRWKSEDAARRLNDWFKLRDCPQTVPLSFADQPELFVDERSAKCMRYELGSCLGPCAGACTRGEYAAGTRAAKGFLDGRDRSLLATLKELMSGAAERFEFEKATALRDRLQTLEWIDARLALLRQARTKNSFVYPLVGHDGRERWYLIHRGQVRAVCFTPSTDAERESAAALIAATFTGGPASPVLAGGAVDSVLMVVAWFRRNAGEAAKLLTQLAATERCRTLPQQG
ncbi:GIY-YIG nuclease family protein [Gemmata sp.]|uniref:GIY-YIG nuclease family protein n=1 Tax=Gemmata sp. TaxID=1914242 RepID=UPI003F706EDD